MVIPLCYECSESVGIGKYVGSKKRYIHYSTTVKLKFLPVNAQTIFVKFTSTHAHIIYCSMVTKYIKSKELHLVN